VTAGHAERRLTADHGSTRVMPRVSVIIPTYNRAALASDAIRSVLSGSYADFEVVVVDDGSTDCTCDVVAALGDPRIVYRYQENAGLAIARNTGASAATGEYLVFLDSDDLLMPHALEAGVACLDARPELGMVIGGYEIVDQIGRKLGEVRPWLEQESLELEDLVMGAQPPPSQWIMRAEWFAHLGGFDPDFARYNGGEDLDFALRLGLAGGQLAWLHAVVARRRLHGGNESSAADKMRSAVWLFLAKAWSNPGLPRDLLSLRDKVYANAYLYIAGLAYGAGSSTSARLDLDQAIHLDRDLLTGQVPRALANLEGVASLLPWPASLACMRAVFDDLPTSAVSLRIHRRRALARVAMLAVFTAYAWGELGIVRSALPRALAYDPAWLLNPGVRSIAVESVLGHRLARSARRAAHGLRAALC
jgi:glycosyltransferase involved in cell wall biosynthesis